MKLRHVAPAGAPMAMTDLARWARRVAGRGDAVAELASLVRARVGVPHAFLTCTGRAGMTVLLRSLQTLAPSRVEVVVPAYTCFSVAASVVRAGLRPRVVDISPDTLDYDEEQLTALDWSRVLAVVATNLYGIPNDLPRWRALTQQQGVFLVDDAAQAMGASIGGRPSGTWGDAGLYSLDKGKNVSAMDGGILVTNDARVAKAIEADLAGLHAPAAGAIARDVAKALAYALLLRPSLYWIPNSVPQLGLGTTIYTTEFAIERYNSVLASLALTMMAHVDRFNGIRRAHAEQILAGVAHRPEVRAVRPLPGSQPVYLRLPMLASNGTLRNELVTALNQAGIGATGSYPTALTDIVALQHGFGVSPRLTPGGRFVAERILTLPTHAYATRADIQSMRACVEATVAAHPGAAAHWPAAKELT